LIILGLILIAFVLMFMAFRGKTRAKTFVPQPGVIETAFFHGLSFEYDSKYKLEEEADSISVIFDIESSYTSILHCDISDFSKEQADYFPELMNDSLLGSNVAINKERVYATVAGKTALGLGCTLFLDGFPFSCTVTSLNIGGSCFSIYFICSKDVENPLEILDAFGKIVDSITIS